MAQLQHPSVDTHASLGARLSALELAFGWLFDRVANETLGPDQMRHAFASEFDELAQRLVQATSHRSPQRLLATVQLASAMRSLADEVLGTR